jgi:hypothetical protein
MEWSPSCEQPKWAEVQSSGKQIQRAPERVLGEPAAIGLSEAYSVDQELSDRSFLGHTPRAISTPPRRAKAVGSKFPAFARREHVKEPERMGRTAGGHAVNRAPVLRALAGMAQNPGGAARGARSASRASSAAAPHRKGLGMRHPSGMPVLSVEETRSKPRDSTQRRGVVPSTFGVHKPQEPISRQRVPEGDESQDPAQYGANGGGAASSGHFVARRQETFMAFALVLAVWHVALAITLHEIYEAHRKSVPRSRSPRLNLVRSHADSMDALDLPVEERVT